MASPRSAVRDAHKLPAGSFLEASRESGVGQPRRYWDVAYEPKRGNRSHLTSELLALLDDAVRDRLVADVPVGAFLSGGLDSALVVARAARQSAEPLRTFTVGFLQTLDEREPARALALAVGARHSERELQLDVVRHLDEVVRRLGEPLGDPSALPTFLVAGLARGEVKVVVTGDGGDETFAGYHRYARTRLSLLYPRLPRPLRRVAALAAARVRPRFLARLAEVEAPRRPLARRQLRAGDEHLRRRGGDRAAPPPIAAAMRVEAASDDALVLLHDGAPAHEWLDRLLYTDLRSYLAESVLVKVDRMTMAHGLEGALAGNARPPAHRVVGAAAERVEAATGPAGKAAAARAGLRAGAAAAPRRATQAGLRHPAQAVDVVRAMLTDGRCDAARVVAGERWLAGPGRARAPARARQRRHGAARKSPLVDLRSKKPWYRLIVKGRS